MLHLGTYQTLTIIRTVSFGVYLSEPDDHKNRVLLPKKQVPADAREGDALEVFLYRDSDDRMIATTHKPLITLGKTAVLTVAAVGKIGAFLSWGLEKDLFLPFREQTGKVRPGDRILAALYIDKSDRLCATMKVYPYLKTNAPYERGDQVSGRVYEVDPAHGAYVAVDDMYSAMIAPGEDLRSLKAGDVVTCRVVNVKEDGKLDLSMRRHAYEQMDEDALKILHLLSLYHGVLPFTEKSDPARIMQETGLSKAAFKRAVGRLYKERRITLDDDHTIRSAADADERCQ